MKEKYMAPAAEAILFQASGSILTGSNEHFGVDPFDPDFVPSLPEIPGIPTLHSFTF